MDDVIVTSLFDCGIVSKVLITLQKYQNQLKIRMQQNFASLHKNCSNKNFEIFCREKMSQKSLKTYLIECETIEIWDRLELWRHKIS